MRLFVALEVPEDVQDRLSDLQDALPHARWVDPAGMHLTLRFIGDLDRRTAEDVDDVLCGIAARPFSVRIEGVGTFGRPVRALWAGVAPNPPLAALAEKVDAALNRLRLDIDRRKFTPHVTLARFREAPGPALEAYLSAHGSLALDPFPVTRFTLFSSFRSHGGAEYTPERHYIL
ncbi:MAG: RNA 2',3'-cyclic phosphodiesterase [Alphaproteobacteria bacterium]